MYGRVLCEKLSKNFFVSGGNPATDLADWELDLNPVKHWISGFRDPEQP
jgi:hypothetical protein